MHLQNNILKVLAYFDIFDYPVSAEEVRFFLEQPVQEQELKAALDALTEEQHLFRLNGFYSLRDNPGLAERRIRGNKHAEELLAIAAKISRFLFLFPYVRGIGISGSLSKNFADENADIDYFIITAPNRLWIARTLMHLFKKLTFLAGKQHWYCMNYYIDEDALNIEEKNIFTAMEMITLLPVYGNGTMEKFFSANDWVTSYYPNYTEKKATIKSGFVHSRFKNAIEFLFNSRAGEWLDNYLMKLTTRRWQEKESAHKLNMRGGRMGLLTGKHFSKPNPAYLQEQVLERYQEKLDLVFSSFLQQHGALCQHRFQFKDR